MALTPPFPLPHRQMVSEVAETCRVAVERAGWGLVGRDQAVGHCARLFPVGSADLG